MNIVFDPVFSTGNKYVNLIVDNFRKRGHQVESLSFAFLNPQFLWKADVVCLNWIENLMGDSKLRIFGFFFKQVSKILLLVILNKKIVWTMHNKVSHEKQFRYFNNILLKILTKVSSAIIIHSELSREILKNNYNTPDNKIHYVPHPNYINMYGPITQNSKKTEDDYLKILFIGALKPYKNIELLIDIANDLKGKSIKFIIKGKSENDVYKNHLLKLIDSNSNINLDPQFIKDEEVSKVISSANVLVFPYSLESSLNSGSLFLAFSYQKTVICPLIGSLLDFENKELFFGYKYNTQKEHKEELEFQINSVYASWIRDKNYLDLSGRKMFEIVKEKNDIDLVVSRLEYFYMGIIN